MLLLLTVLGGMLLFSEFTLRTLYPEVRMPPQPAGWAIIPEASWIEYHPVLGWFHQKNKSAELVKQALKVPITTNGQGLRGTREYSVQKPPGVRRIYALGDSFTFGFGVRDDETFSAQIELSSPDFEVLNLGVAGYGVDQIRLLAREFGYQYAPDIVLISIYPEDFWRATRAFNDAGYGKPFFRRKADGALHLQHVPVPRFRNFSVTQFPELLHLTPFERSLYRLALYRSFKKAVTRFKKLTGREDPESGHEWLLGRDILRDLIHEIRGAGAVPVLVIVPPMRWITGTVEPIRDSLIRFGAREGTDVIDLTSVFQDAAKKMSIEQLYIQDDHHWTAEGHSLVAQTIINYITGFYSKIQ